MSKIDDLIGKGLIPYSSGSTSTTQEEQYLVNRVAQIDNTSKSRSLAKICVEKVVNQKKETFERAVVDFNTDAQTSDNARKLLKKYANN